MSDTWALLPVKQVNRSKTRLQSVLRPQECALLSRAMFMDVLAAMEAADSIDRIAVLTNDAQVADLARRSGHTVIEDTDEELCAGLDAAARQIRNEGGERVLIMPGDIPTVTATDIDGLMARHTDGLSLCPAIRDGGTNAMVCTPPDAIPFQFGPDSANRHLEAAQAAGLPHERMATAAFFRDIDLPEDLLWLSARDNDCHTLNFLRQSGICARLGPDLAGAQA
jgi:2-phospho-L-lactate guanylyltransferase